MKSPERDKHQKIALERIWRLFEQSEESFGTSPARSKRYIGLIRKVAMRYNVRIPKEIKKRFCNSCNSLLISGKNARMRTSRRQQCVVVTCLECGNIMRYPYRKEKSINKRKAK